VKGVIQYIENEDLRILLAARKGYEMQVYKQQVTLQRVNTADRTKVRSGPHIALCICIFI